MTKYCFYLLCLYFSGLCLSVESVQVDDVVVRYKATPELPGHAAVYGNKLIPWGRTVGVTAIYDLEKTAKDNRTKQEQQILANVVSITNA